MCRSDEDPSCLDSPSDAVKKNCGHVIADLPADRFRCMTIHAKEGDEELVFRRCSTDNECKYQVENGKFSYGKTYNTAVCKECVGDYCNKDKLL